MRASRWPPCPERSRAFLCPGTPNKEMVPTPLILAWRILWTEKPDWLQSMGLQRVGHD